MIEIDLKKLTYKISYLITGLILDGMWLGIAFLMHRYSPLFSKDFIYYVAYYFFIVNFCKELKKAEQSYKRKKTNKY